MSFFLNILLARLAVVLVILTSIIYLFRKFNKNNDLIKRVNRSLRKKHKLLGILLIIVGLIHGLLSSEAIFSFNLGTICEILSILLGINFYIGMKYKIKGWMHYHRIITLLFLLSLIVHIVDVGGFTSDLIEKSFSDNSNNIEYNNDFPTQSSKDENNESADNQTENNSQKSNNNSNDNSSSTKYKDGVYQGVAHGYGPNLTVEVTVKNGAISNIEILSHNERNPRFYQSPMDKVPSEIIANQSTDVDIVVGSTKTSKGIMNAVKDALSNAV
ncbi:FMN-binding protein [Clostridium frigidicarnis]|uniref:FMN-binding domain-containing protein n=1 Tax=Clostridium frigidicarnis TaxID=84698 RepID=A0A1I0YC98_9CLOT|nr:FMN-binding protein [Clostridium frigidicarnis]SFB10944.1 FMN-binding domain-containing protein [Clostridium frigidicarnis]